MGQEAVCRVRAHGREAEAKVLLESTELIVRGELRLRIPFSEIAAVEVADGVLSLSYPGGRATLELGARAERWAERIRNPPTLASKLGIGSETRVAVLDVDDAALLEAVREGTLVEGEPERPIDVLLFQVDDPGALARIATLEPLIERDGAVWVVYPRGRPDLREADVLAAGRSAGLVDTKTARVSETRTSTRFQVPKARR